MHGKEVFIPILRGPTADINATLALALIAMFMVQYYGFKYQGFKYLKKFFNFSNPINAFVGILELVSEFSKIISFTFRLFGNIFAGEVLIAVMTFLIPVVAPMPFYALELFVGVIQGLVFMMLSTVFMNMATLSHDGGDH
jgi:F-type H+-transporting ATPase subunit a